MPERWQIFDTPNPAEPGVQTDVVIRDLVPGDLKALGTPLSDFPDLIKFRIPSDWHSYKFCQIVKSTPGVYSLLFCKPKTPTEALVAFEEFSSNEEYAWPDVLLGDISFIPDEKLAQRSITPVTGGTQDVYSPTIYTQRRMRIGATLDSPTITRLYLSDTTPFPFEAMAHIEPLPQEIYWDFANAQGKLLCLHKKVILPARTTPYKTVNGGTVENVASPYIPGFTFPATNYTDWAPFILRRRQKKVNGIYLMEEVEISPPYLPKPITIG